MGSGDLNMKKSWHPQRSGNIAATQQAEAEAIAERKKLQQRLQEIEEERRKEEIQKTLEAAGGKRRIDRVEWMYSGPTDGQGAGSAENEAYLLGKRRIDKLLQDNEVKKLSKQASQDNIVAVPTINNARDIATKIREDPLLAIKRQEQQAYEAMMNDPIKRRQLLASMGIEDPQAKPKRKEEKRDRQHRHHHRSHRSHRDDYDREDDRHSRRRRSDSRDRSRSPRRDRSRDGRRDRSRSPRRHRSRSPRRERSRSSRRYDDNDRRRGRKDSPVRDRRRSQSAEDRYGRDRRDKPRREDKSPRRREEERPRSPSPKRTRDRSPDLARHSRRPDDDRNGERDRSYRQPRRDYGRDDRSTQDRRGHGNIPGNAFSNAAVDEEEAAKERARKIAAMQEAATDLDKDRERRLAAIEAAERAQKEADDHARQASKKYGGKARFTNSLHSQAADMKVADRVRAR